jgi:hypothetical protein
VRRVAQSGAFVLAILATVGRALLCAGVATGLLYLLRPHVAALGGTLVSDALPLDELPNHAAIPLPIFVAVWSAVGMSAALLIQPRRSRRADVGFACVLWLCALAGSATSVFIVRQVSPLSGLETALTIPAVYIAPLLAGLGAGVVRIRRVQPQRTDQVRAGRPSFR